MIVRLTDERNKILHKLLSLLKILNKVIEEDNITEYERLVNKKNMLLTKYRIITEKINSFMVSGNTIPSKCLDLLKHQEKDWEVYRKSEVELINKTEKIKNDLGVKSQKLVKNGHIKSAYKWHDMVKSGKGGLYRGN